MSAAPGRSQASSHRSPQGEGYLLSAAPGRSQASSHRSPQGEGTPAGGPTRELHVAEPPASYLQRRPLVVDCSAISGLLFQEHWQAQAVQKISDRALHAPYLLHAELASVAVKKHKQGLVQIADDGLAQFQVMDIDLHPIKVQEVVSLALRYQLSFYDAAYLWLAAELKAPLATFDEQLATAAKAHLATLT